MTNPPGGRDGETPSSGHSGAAGDTSQPHASFGPDSPNEWGEPAHTGVGGQPPVTGPIPVPPPSQPAYNAPTVIPPGQEIPAASASYVAPPPFAPQAETLPGGFAYSAPLPAEPRRRRKLPLILSAVGVVVLVIAGAVAFAVTRVLSGGGTQPEQVLPATTIAFAKIDLDPAADQKIAAFRLARHFPSLRSTFTNSGNVKDSLLRSLFAGSTDLNYQTDIKPWLGDRAAVAAVPRGRTAEPVLAARYSDEAKMQAALKKAATKGETFGWVESRGYVLISDTQAHAADVVAQASRQSLASNTTFDSDVHALKGNQVAEAWVDFADLGDLSQSLPGTFGSLGSLAGGASTATGTQGRLVAGVHLSSDYLELNGLVRGAVRNTSTAAAGMIEQLPADTTAALELGLGTSVASSLAALPQATKDQLSEYFSDIDLTFPDDVVSILGSDMTAAVHVSRSNSASFAIQTQTTNPTGAVSALQRVLRQMDLDSTVRAAATKNGYVLFNDSSYSSSLGSHTGAALGTDPTFTKAVPDASGAVAVGYVNIGAIADSGVHLGSNAADLKHISAIGLTERADSFRIRVTTR